MKQKLAALLLIFSLLFTTACGAAADFRDVPSDAQYAEAVAWCKEQGLLQGVGENKFDPDGTLDRRTMATVLHRLAGEPVVNYLLRFEDVPADQWYTEAIRWAASEGIMRGYSDTQFGAADPVSQEQLQVILDRYLGKGDTWVGDPNRAAPATRADIAVVLETTLKPETPAPAPAPATGGYAPALPPASEPQPDPVPAEPEGGKTLVVYFSCTNTTKAVAEMIARATGGDLFEIVPAEGYTAADLNYSNNGCRANREQNDDSAMPAIAADCTVADWNSYDTVFLGHPIWWGIPPKILRSFCAQYDWTGKTIVGFATSGSSPYKNTGLPELTPGAAWLDTRLLNRASQTDVSAWVERLNLSAKEETTVNKLTVSFNGHSYTAALAENASVDAFVAYLREQGGSVTVEAHDYGNFEKVGPLGTTIVRSDEPIDTVPGDIILYQGSNVCLYYSTNSWNFTRLGKLEGDLSSLQADLGGGDVSIVYALN